jgi:hypothetical protein
VEIDLTQITLGQFIIVLGSVAIVDVGVGILAAITAGTFSPAHVADFIKTHVLYRVFPIASLAFLSLSVPEVSEGTSMLWIMACGSLAAYLVETVGSVRESFSAATN